VSLLNLADTSESRKARGAYFTPDAIADFVTEWAVRDVADRVFEPSCGEAAFLVSAVNRLRSLRRDDKLDVPSDVWGVEIHAASADAARLVVRAAGGSPNIITSDFFLVEPEPLYSAVIGNPPYIRYQDFAGEPRARSRAAALRAGVPISGLASSWAAFTIHSALFLKKGGRLGLVLPAELLSVNYAAEVRKFLFQRFRTVDLVLFTERVFPEAQADVVLLLADGFDEGSTDHASIHQAQNASELGKVAAATTWKPAAAEDKWTPSLLSTDALTAYNSLIEAGSFVPLETWGDTTLGMVTGNNKYFALSSERFRALGLERSDVIKLSPPGSSHLRGLAYSDRAHRDLGARGGSTLLFRPAGEPSEAALGYIAAGETANVHMAYKCRVRKPWWRVPLVKPADMFLTYMNADTPRLTSNDAKAHHLNSVHGIYLRDQYRALGRTNLALASLTSMTLVGAETVGRAYGGGLLKIEPREADRLPVPTPELVEREQKRLAAIRPHVSEALRYGRLVEAAAALDDVLLRGALGMARSEVNSLRLAHEEMRARRVARARGVSDS
jgi:adenine-specific DNA-methyltransferase